MPEYVEGQTNEYLEHAEACKYLFREFLEFVLVKGWYMPTPPQYPIGKLQQTYDRSDFDWRDPEAFEEFRKWFKELFTAPQSQPPAPPDQQRT
ncbi:hypothetical protein JW752_02575 [Candidatus Peregrinibacteria bacterium]|nr:hypothetical protein [Candidatus Peregrinibacteria bacterium]